MTALCPFRSAGPLPSRLDIAGATTVRQPGGVNGSSPSSLNACLELEPAPGPGGGCVVRYVGNGLGYYYRQAASLRADVPVPLDCPLFYWEVEVLDGGEDGSVGMGFAAACVPLSRLPGWDPDSYGYHGDDGKKFAANGRGTPYGPRYGAGDVVGSLLDRVRRVVEFFRNGTSLGVAFTDVPDTQALYPVVGLRTRGSRVVVNWGPHTKGGRPFKLALRPLEIAARKMVLDEITDVRLQLFENDQDYADGKASSNTIVSGRGRAAPRPVPFHIRPRISLHTASFRNGNGSSGRDRGTGGGDGGGDGRSDVLLDVVLEHLLREGLAGTAAALVREAGPGVARRVSGRLVEATTRQQVVNDVRAGRPLAALQRLESRYCRSGCLWCGATALTPAAQTHRDPILTTPTRTHTRTHKSIHGIHNGITGVNSPAVQDDETPTSFVTDTAETTCTPDAPGDGDRDDHGSNSDTPSCVDDVTDRHMAVATANSTSTCGTVMVGAAGGSMPPPALIHWRLRLQVFLSLVGGGAPHAALEFAREHLTVVTPPPECTTWGLQRRVLAALQATGEPAPPGLLLGTTIGDAAAGGIGIGDDGGGDTTAQRSAGGWSCTGEFKKAGNVGYGLDMYGAGLSCQPVTPGSSVALRANWSAGRQGRSGWAAAARGPSSSIPTTPQVTTSPSTTAAALPAVTAATVKSTGADAAAAATSSYPSSPLSSLQWASHPQSNQHKPHPCYGPGAAAPDDPLPAPSTPLPRPQLTSAATPASGTATAAACFRLPHRPQAIVTGICEQSRKSSGGGGDLASQPEAPSPSSAATTTVPSSESAAGDPLSAMELHHHAHVRLRNQGMWGGTLPGTATAAAGGTKCAGAPMQPTNTTAARGMWGAAAECRGVCGGRPQRPGELRYRGTDGSAVTGSSGGSNVKVSVPVEELQEALSLLAYTDPRVTGVARLLSAAGREGLVEQVNDLMLALNYHQKNQQQLQEEGEEQEEAGAVLQGAVMQRGGKDSGPGWAPERPRDGPWSAEKAGGCKGHLTAEWRRNGEESSSGSAAYSRRYADGVQQQLRSSTSGNGVKHNGASGGGDSVTAPGQPQVYGMAAERSPLERLYRQCTAVWDELQAAVDCPAAQLVDWRQELLAVRHAML